MGQICYPETSVNNYKRMSHKNNKSEGL